VKITQQNEEGFATTKSLESIVFFRHSNEVLKGIILHWSYEQLSFCIGHWLCLRNNHQFTYFASWNALFSVTATIPYDCIRLVLLWCVVVFFGLVSSPDELGFPDPNENLPEATGDKFMQSLQ